MRAMKISAFFVFFLTVSSLIHFYIWQRLAVATQLPVWLQRVSGLFFLILIFSIPLSFLVYRYLEPNLAKTLSQMFLIWAGMSLVVIFSLFSADILLLLQKLISYFIGTNTATDWIENPDRRLFLRRTLSFGALAAAVVATSRGLSAVARGPAIKEVSVVLKKIPAALSGFKIVQISDLHVGATVQTEYVQQVVEMANGQNPDLIVLTGDLVDGNVPQLGPYVNLFKNLKATHGVFMVTGNHEYYSGVDQWVEFLKSIGIKVLINSHAQIGSGDAKFNLAGVCDYTSGEHHPTHRWDLNQTLSGISKELPTVLLAHQPRGCFEAFEKGVDLQLSGHTHAGQIFPFGLFVRLVQPFVQGLHYVGESAIYVNPGTAYWGPPLRVATQSEITALTLKNI